MKHVARKRFGQHFLSDAYVLGAIVDLIDPQPGQALVEIGPGLGALTWPVAGALPRADGDRARPRPGRAAAPARRRLERDRGRRAEGRLRRTGDGNWASRCGVVGNLPYNISTPILFHLLEAAGSVVDQHFMLQKEVAQRMAAAPGGKDYGRLSVMLQWRYRIDTVLDVPPQAFESAAAGSTPPSCACGRWRRPTVQPKLLAELVAVAFSQRRKLLRHTLGRWLRGAGFRRQLRPAAACRGSAGGAIRGTG